MSVVHPVFATLKLSLVDHVAVIILNRPEQANGMNMELIMELAAAASHCDALVNAHQVRAVVITGEGRIFCAGGDIHSFKSFGDDVSREIARLAGYLHEATATFMHMKAPVITAVNGAAAGAGFSLAIMGDIVIASQSASFMLAYTAIGLSPDGAATWHLPRIVGLRRAQEMLLLNRKLSADEALQWGLVTKVVADEQLMHETMALAKKLANGPTNAFGTVKMLLNASDKNSPEQQMALEAENLSALSSSIDGQEGIRAFLDKRKPVFQGK
jgi:2-(1,2-epoxy-1,2-dihydrophenyl)acetyl-CoA isomerase